VRIGKWPLLKRSLGKKHQKGQRESSGSWWFQIFSRKKTYLGKRSNLTNICARGKKSCMRKRSARGKRARPIEWHWRKRAFGASCDGQLIGPLPHGWSLFAPDASAERVDLLLAVCLVQKNAQGHIGCLVPSWQRETTSITSCCDILWYQALRFKDLFASLRSWVVSAPWSSLKNAWQA